MNKLTCCVRAPVTTNTPLIASASRQPSCCTIKRVTAIAITTLAGVAFVGYVALLVRLVKPTYECIRTNFEERDKCGFVAGVDAFALMVICCFVVCARFACKRRQRLRQEYPHISFHKGMMESAFCGTSFEQMERSEKLRDPAVTKPIVAEVVKSIQQLGFQEDWLKAVGKASVEEAASSYKMKGFCYGHALSMLDQMGLRYNASSRELEAHLKIEKIFFYQLATHILYDIWDKGGSESNIMRIYAPSIEQFTKNFLVDPNHKRDFTQILSREFLLLSFMERCRKLDLKGVLFYQGPHFDVSSNPMNLETYLNQTIQNLEKARKEGVVNYFGSTPHTGSEDVTIAGTIILYQKQKIDKEHEEKLKTDKEAKEKQFKTAENFTSLQFNWKFSSEDEHAAHALFYQCTDVYRFYDYGSSLNGFFEFPNQKLFFEGLAKHIQAWRCYRDGQLAITVHAIPKARRNEVAVKIDGYQSMDQPIV